MSVKQIFQAVGKHMDQVSSVGIPASLSKEEARRKKVISTLAYITMYLVAIYGTIFFIFTHDWLILLPAWGFAGIFALLLWAGRQQMFGLARLGLIFTFLLILIYYGISLGRSADAQVLAIFIMSITVLTSDPEDGFRQRIFAVSVAALGIGIVEVAYYFNWTFFGYKADLKEPVSFVYRVLIIAVVVALNFIAIHLYQDSVEKLLVVLRNRNNTLRKSRDENQRQKKQLQAHGDKLAKDVEDRTAELHRANESKSIFIVELGNEISSPLNAIIDISRQLSASASGGHITPQQLQVIQSNSDQLQQLMRNVRQLSELEEGGQGPLKLAPFELRAWVEHAVGFYSVSAKSHQITILKEIDNRFPDTIVTDRDVLGDVVHHVLSSAVKFTEARKIVRVRCFMNAGKLFIQVCDQSTGFAMDKIGSLFRPFDQADRELCRRFGGSGFGLAVAKKKIQLLGGDLQISSSVGEGTNFLISWPAKVPERIEA